MGDVVCVSRFGSLSVSIPLCVCVCGLCIQLLLLNGIMFNPSIKCIDMWLARDLYIRFVQRQGRAWRVLYYSLS